MRKHFVLSVFTFIASISVAQDGLTFYTIDRQFSTEEVLSKLELSGLTAADYDDLSVLKAKEEQKPSIPWKKETRMHSSSTVKWSTIVALDTAGSGWPSALERTRDGMDLAYKTGLKSDAQWPAGTSFLAKRK